MRSVADCVIFDIDGTLADNRHRLHLITGVPKKWDEFFDLAGADGPIIPIIKIAQTFVDATAGGLDMVMLSARPERILPISRGWLNQWDLGRFARIYHRPNEDYRPGWEWKEEVLRERIMPFRNPIMAFDDDPLCVGMFRRNQVPTYHVTEMGPFVEQIQTSGD